MGHTYHEICYHIVFSTKERAPLIEESQSSKIYAYMAKIINTNFGKCHLINGMPDHIHVLANLKPAISISDALLKLKGDTSRWINKEKMINQHFSWQIGYGIFSVSHSNIKAVYKYVANQQEHHKTMDFKRELRALLAKHNIEYDEKYIWG